MTIAVFGSINVDVTAYSRLLPVPGETIHGESYVLGLGGKGANQAVAVARLEAALSLVGRVGRDPFGQLARAELERFGVRTSGIAEDGTTGTGIAIIAVDSSAQNCITVIAGANFKVGADDVDRLAAVLGAVEVLLLQLEVPLAPNIAAARLARSRGGSVILDPAPAPLSPLPDALLECVDVITPNEVECEALTGIRPAGIGEARDAAMVLRARGIGRVVVKMGAKGAFWLGSEGEGHVPGFAVEALDTVGAGDCFNGGLAVALAGGQTFGEAVRFASACGALSTTRRGAAAAAASLAEVAALLARDHS